jgi:GWxTD domain-containing protein
MEQFAWTLIHFVWQGALIAALCALGFAAAGGPRWRYALGVFALALMAAAPPLTWLALQQPGPSGAGFELPSVLPPPPAGGFSGGTEPAAPWIAWIPLLWSCGAGALSARVLLVWILEFRRERLAKPLEAEWRRRFELVAMAMSITQRWRAAVSDRIAVPQVSGVFRPLLLLPASALSNIPPEQLEAIVAHELAHIRRHDYLVNLFQTAVECLLFYHPAVWWLSSRIRQERELCCDAAAVGYCGDRASYARALLALEEARPALSLAASSGSLRERVARLLGYRPASSFALPAVAVLLIAAGVAWAAQAQPPQPPPPPAAPAPAAPRIAGGASPGIREKIKRELARAEIEPQRPSIEKQMAMARQQLETPYGKWLGEDVAYIVSDAERIAFLSLQSGHERERFIEQFWLRRDPTPGTPVNEFKEEHYRRIAYANERFASGIPGWRTDRGRVYISLGPPDEIEGEPGKTETWKYNAQGGAPPGILRFEGKSMRLMTPQPPQPPQPPSPPPPAQKKD